MSGFSAFLDSVWWGWPAYLLALGLICFCISYAINRRG